MMAKLYWRVKRNGKWTWRPAEHEPLDPVDDLGYVVVFPITEEDE